MQLVLDLQLYQQPSLETEAQFVAVSTFERAILVWHIVLITSLIFVRLPPIEAIMEILVTKADPSAALMLKEEPLCVINDMANLLSGHTISFLEFS